MDKKELLRQLPKVDELLFNHKIQFYMEQVSRDIILEIIRDEIETVRQHILQGVEDDIVENGTLDVPGLIDRIVAVIWEKNEMSLKRVINATGTILHTNLGRALISREIKEHMIEIACHYSNLEYDIEQGKRGSRYGHVEKLITQLTGGEAALVVNNNAAAVMLVLNTMAKNKEVIVSRGELVEIGGSFRIPEIMEQSGVFLKEAGSTNKTHLKDYRQAIDPEKTGALLKVHTSNYRILGFTDEVSLQDMVSLGQEYHIPVIHDLGSGSLIDLKEYGILDEPLVMDSVKAEADIICFSGDKLLGGPQAGIILGKREWIEKMKENPFIRAFRIDKLTLAVLEATLHMYISGDPVKRIPTLKMMTMSMEKLKEKALKVFNALQNFETIEVDLREGSAQIGGGSLPLHQLPGWIIHIYPLTMSVNEFEKALRDQIVPIIARIQKDAILLDVRTIEEESLDYVIQTIWNI